MKADAWVEEAVGWLLLVSAFVAIWKYGFWETWSTVKSWVLVLTMGGLALGLLVIALAALVLLLLGMLRREINAWRLGRGTVSLMARVNPGRREALPRGRMRRVIAIWRLGRLAGRQVPVSVNERQSSP